MKIPLAVALVGFAISFALPIFAQQKDTPTHKYASSLRYHKKFATAFNNGDAAALAALYTEDAVLVNDSGPIYGREAIEKYYADLFQKVHFSNHISKAGFPAHYRYDWQ